MLAVKIKTQFEGFHCWPEAPEEVKFLRDLHRHMFYVKVVIEVKDNDRELEFFILQRRINKMIVTMKEDLEKKQRMSCESMAEYLLDFLEIQYPSRKMEVEVNEDNENGSIANNLESFINVK